MDTTNFVYILAAVFFFSFLCLTEGARLTNLTLFTTTYASIPHQCHDILTAAQTHIFFPLLSYFLCLCSLKDLHTILHNLHAIFSSTALIALRLKDLTQPSLRITHAPVITPSGLWTGGQRGQRLTGPPNFRGSREALEGLPDGHQMCSRGALAYATEGP